MNRVQLLVDRLNTARAWTTDLLTTTDETKWFEMPAPGVGHIAWQVGHLAVSQVALIPVRCFDQPFTAFATDLLRRQFGRGSTPTADSGAYPSIPEIRSFFDEIQHRCVEMISGLSDAALDQSTTGEPHPMFSNRAGAIGTAVMHETFHGGQIAVIRRMFGLAPLR